MDKIKRDAVKFTSDRQVDGKLLPFPNTLIENVNGTLVVDMYRSTQRVIPSDSFHDYKHKMAAYHSMAHFMVSIWQAHFIFPTMEI